MSSNEERAERGWKAIRLHPDYTLEETATCASDIIADILHSLDRAGHVLPSEMDDFVARALRTYEGDAEDDEE